MTEHLEEKYKFEITSAQLGDAVGIGEAHLKSWLETYPNEALGVTEDWILQEFGFLTAERGIKFREDVIKKLNNNVKYMVVKDEAGTVQGFLHASKNGVEAKLDAIYLTAPLKGTGVADELMKEVLRFTENLPINLQVAAYNERAIRFYERYGFVEGEQEAELFHGKIPILNMKREVTHEV